MKNIFRNYIEIREKYGFGSYLVPGIEEGPVCVLNSNNAQGQETPVGNQRGERRSASSPGRRGQRHTRFGIVRKEAIALGMSWVG